MLPMVFSAGAVPAAAPGSATCCASCAACRSVETLQPLRQRRGGLDVFADAHLLEDFVEHAGAQLVAFGFFARGRALGTAARFEAELLPAQIDAAADEAEERDLAQQDGRVPHHRPHIESREQEQDPDVQRYRSQDQQVIRARVRGSGETASAGSRPGRTARRCRARRWWPATAAPARWRARRRRCRRRVADHDARHHDGQLAQGRVSNGLSMSVDMTGGSKRPSAICSIST